MAPSTRSLLRSFFTLVGFSHFVTGAPHPLGSRRALSDPFPFSPGFDIQSVAALSEQLPSHSWEYGTESEVLLELYNPELSVFGTNPFPPLLLDASNVQALAYAKSKIQLNLSDNAGANVLSNGDGATGDPASLGVPAVLLGLSDPTYMEAAEKTMGYLVGSAPRWANGAISHRADVAELWADHIYMAPPFLAYYAVITSNTTLLQEAVNQCSHYRDVLVTSPSNPSINPTLDAEQKASVNGLWHHIIGPQSTDLGLWSTGNAWAAGGITRILATVLKAPLLLTLGWKDEAVSGLTALLKEILDTAILNQDITVDPANGFLRNYLDDRNGTAEAGHGFGEISGSAMLSAVIYRLAVLAPELVPVPSPYFEFAESIRSTLGSGNHISADGTAAPTANPLCWQCTDPFTTGSPEGQSFVIALYTGWRDCVKAGICPLYCLIGCPL